MASNIHPRVPKLTGGAIERRLAGFEQKYAMGTLQFMAAYTAGTLDDNADYVDWSGLQAIAGKPSPRRRTSA